MKPLIFTSVVTWLIAITILLADWIDNVNF